MADLLYVSSEVAGNAAHPVSGEAAACGPDTAFQAGTAPADDSNIGTSADPKLTLDSLPFLGVATDVFITGRFRTADANAYLTNVNADVTTGAMIRVSQWSGQPRTVAIGRNFPGGTLANNLTKSATYWQAATNGWKILCDGTNGKPDLTAATLADVTLDADAAANWTSVGLPKCHLDLAANIAAITGGTRGAQGKYFLDTVTNPGTLYILLPTNNGGASQANDPTAVLGNGIEYTIPGRTGMSFISGGTNHESPMVDGVVFSSWGAVSDVAPYGCGLNLFYTVNAVVSGCTFIDSHDHGLAFGGHVENATVTNCTFLGAEVGSFYLVFNASGVGNTASGSVTNTTFYATGMLGHDGLKITGSTGSIGVFVHGAHSGIVLTNVTFNVYVPASGTPNSFLPIDSGDATAPSDLTRAANYPILVDRCTVNNSTEWFNEGVTSYIGFRNTSIFGTQVNAVYQVGLMARSSTAGRWHFEGCQIAANLANPLGGGTIHMFEVGAAFTVSLLNCTVYDTASSHSAGHKQGMFNRPALTKTIDQITTGAAPVIRTTAAHGYAVGTNVVISASNSTPAIDGVFKVATVPDSTHFTLVAVPGGTASVPTVTVAGTSATVNGFGNVIASGCDFAFRASDRTMRMSNGDSTCPIGLTFTDCRFYGVTTDEWSENASLNSDAEWAASMSGTIVLAANPVADATGASLAPTAAAKATKKQLATHITNGVNGQPYDGSYGAFQYGAAGGGGLGRTGARAGGRLTRLTR